MLGNLRNMGDNGSVRMGLNSSSSGMNTGAVSEKFVAGLAMNSGSTVRTSHGGKCFYSSGLDPIGSLSQSENFGTAPMAAHGVFANPSYPVASENRDMNGTSHLAYYSSDPHVEMVPKIAVFGDGNYSEMVNPFGLPGCGQNYAGVCPEKYSSTKNMPTDRALVASPNGKRKRVSDPPSPSNPFKTTEGDPPGDLSVETSELKESDEKKQNNKQTGKQVKDISQDGEASKGNDIHVRARRGQATNSHSLAERVRREKISERMRLLQELVPGCSKITGKAVMLDEIINYVQSLQQQVEFLSMKLATVNPELNFNIEQILSKDILHLQRVGTPSLGFNPVSSSSHPYALGIQGALLGISNASTRHHTLAQGMWDSEMQGLFHMGLNSNPVVENLGPNVRSKPEP